MELREKTDPELLSNSYSQQPVRLWREWGRSITSFVVVFVIFLPLISSCYIPHNFVMEIRVGRNGDYGLVYNGLLIWVPLYEAAKNHELDPEELAAKEAAVLRDLQRDSSFSLVEPLGSGQFRVAYEKKGRILGTAQVAFPRRGADVVRIDVRKSGVMYIAVAATAKPGARKKLEALGLRPQGKMRVITNAAVLKHNAHRIRHGLDDPSFSDWSTFDWTISGPDQPTPSLQIQFMAPQK